MGKSKGTGNPNWIKGAKSPNPEGRKPGNKNKSTQEIRDFLQAVMAKKLPEYEGDLEKMNPFQKWQIVSRLSDKFLPNLSNVEMDANVTGDIKISVSFEDENKSPEEGN